MEEVNTHTLTDSRTGELALRIQHFEGGSSYNFLQRHNYFTILWIRKGFGKFKVDFSEYNLEPSMLFFTPYQPFMLLAEGELFGIALSFHPDFFCIEKHRNEVACNGVLFNNIYQAPQIILTADDEKEVERLIGEIQRELQEQAIAQRDLLVAQLKILLILASRIKIAQSPHILSNKAIPDQPLVKRFQEHIEQHFKIKHSTRDYALMLNITPKALGKLTKTHFGKTPSELIHERIIIEAKRELYLTHKTVKEIAYNLGFEDEYYFSRFFKNMTEASPQIYRDSVGVGRGSIS